MAKRRWQESHIGREILETKRSEHRSQFLGHGSLVTFFKKSNENNEIFRKRFRKEDRYDDSKT